jgi:hypothetical protein
MSSAIVQLGRTGFNPHSYHRRRVDRGLTVNRSPHGFLFCLISETTSYYCAKIVLGIRAGVKAAGKRGLFARCAVWIGIPVEYESRVRYGIDTGNQRTGAGR